MTTQTELFKNNNIENKEYHSNGLLAYEETISIITKGDYFLNDNSRKSEDGSYWIRTGRNAKYHDNGQIAWVLNYDDKGDLLEEDKDNTNYHGP